MFCVEDTCALRDSSRLIGVIDRTFTDIDSHESDPQQDYAEAIVKDEDIPADDFLKFMKTGIPPQGTVLVSWTHSKVELISESKIILIDRAFFVGDVVKTSARSHLSGTVIGTSARCTLLPSYKLESAVAVSGERDVQAQLTQLGLLRDIPSNEVTYACEYHEGCLIIYGNWIGRVEDVIEEVTIRLENGSVVVPHRADELEMIDSPTAQPSVGDRVRAKKGNLRRGRWKFGAYNPNVKPEGIVVDVRAVEISVHWLTRKFGANDPTVPGPAFTLEEPPLQLDLDDIEDGRIIVYDATSSPPDQSITSDNHTYEYNDVAFGDRVRFKDLTGACVKYDGTKTLEDGLSQGQLRRIARTETLGYDINVFLVTQTVSQVTVLWQDLTTTKHQSIDLIPDLNVDDEDEVWPGEIVCTKERNPVPKFSKTTDPESTWFFEPMKVGVVQSVRGADRIAVVKWFIDGCVAFLEDDLLPGSKTGTNLTAPEEISLYDIRSPPGLNRRRGDYVILNPDAVITIPEDVIGTAWFGSVIDLRLDGMLTVRLGACIPVIDLDIPAEFVMLAYSSDMHHSFNHNGDAFVSDEDEMDSDEDEEYDSDNYNDMWYEYQNQEGTIITVRDHSGDDDGWSTEEEDDDDSPEDESMQDAEEVITSHTTPDSPPDINHPTNPQEPILPAEPENTDKTEEISLSLNSHPDSPALFSVLDTSPPQDHHFISMSTAPSPQLLRRIQKEHKILRSSLPEGIFVRTWESRLDLLRVLIIGPVDTPYEFAPFLIDLYFGPAFPSHPPDTFFHSWTNGYGPVNPNLYEDGKICLSLLGTWHADERNENWSPARSTVLQVLVSLMGLVLVKEPYYNEAGYETRAGTEETMLPSALYTERAYFRARGFITHALTHSIGGFDEELKWLYLNRQPNTPMLLTKAINACQDIVQRSESSSSGERDGLRCISAGALIPLRRQLNDLEGLRRLEC